MPKIILEFQLPEEQGEFEYANNGARASSVIEDLDSYLRSKLKHTDLNETEERVYTEVRRKLWELRNEN